MIGFFESGWEYVLMLELGGGVLFFVFFFLVGLWFDEEYVFLFDLWWCRVFMWRLYSFCCFERFYGVVCGVYLRCCCVYWIVSDLSWSEGIWWRWVDFVGSWEVLLWCVWRLSVDFVGMLGCVGLYSDGRICCVVCLVGIVIGYGVR